MLIRNIKIVLIRSPKPSQASDSIFYALVGLEHNFESLDQTDLNPMHLVWRSINLFVELKHFL